MKILILTMTCGEGHNAIARSISNELENRNIESKIVNIFRSNKFFYYINSVGYITMVKYFPRIYSYFWQKNKNTDFDLRYKNNSYHKMLNRVSGDILNEINVYNPEIIVTTNVYASTIVNDLRRNNKIDKNIKLYALNTDLYPCPYWECAIENDYVFMIDEIANDEMIKRGYKQEQLVTAGFPTNKLFCQEIDKLEARKQLKMDENMFTVLLASGGFGLTDNAKIVKRLIDAQLPIQIICLNGKNKKSYNKTNKLIKKLNLKNVFNYSYVDNVAYIMSTCDLVSSRGGCSMLHEAICLEKPLLISDDVINQEKENADFFESKGIAIQLKDKKEDLIEKIKLLIEDKERFEKMKENCKNYKNKYGVDVICDFIINNQSIDE